MRTILGLGNPGSEYEGTRHNAGFLLADHLAKRWGWGSFRREGAARVARGKHAGIDVQLIKPQTYMNRSGAVLARLQALPEFDPARDLLVVVDDVALPVGRFRLRAQGSAGGHNGLKSVEGALHTREYARLRIGAGPPPSAASPASTDSPALFSDLADYVLDRFSPEEVVVVRGLLDRLSEAVECWLEEGTEPAMNRFNR